MNGPDHRASLEPSELTAMVNSIRNIEAALGSCEKAPSKSELKNIPIARKSIVAKKDISKGESFTVENITVKRPGNGVSPIYWFSVLGEKANRDYAEDEMIVYIMENSCMEKYKFSVVNGTRADMDT
jgi:N,N'-diacetyllegionaminate synthase